MLYIICTKNALRDCVLRVVSVLKIPLRCHWCCCFRYIGVSPSLFFCFVLFFSFWFVRSGPIYSSIYLEIFVGARTCKCRVDFPFLKVFCVSGFCFICDLHLLFCYFFYFSFFFFCFLTLSNCRGKTHCKSFTVPWGVFWASGGRLCCSEPASPTCPQSGLPCGGGWQWDIWWVTDHRPPPHPSVCCIIVRLCVNQMSVWATIPMPVFALNLPPIALPPPLPHPPPVGLSE